MVVNDGGVARAALVGDLVHKFMNREVLVFCEAKFVNARFDPVGKLLLAFYKAVQFPCIDGGGRLLQKR